MIERRKFITLLGGAAAAWPLAAPAQINQMRRVGILAEFSESDSQGQEGISAFREAAAKLGWIENRNLRLDLRFAGTDLDRMHALAAGLVSLSPDVNVTAGGATTREAQRQTQTTARAAAHPVQADHQSHHYEGTRHHGPARAARPCR
jgi:putative tryptophan/tyrosine transport system substrate-binding protein